MSSESGTSSLFSDSEAKGGRRSSHKSSVSPTPSESRSSHKRHHHRHSSRSSKSDYKRHKHHESKDRSGDHRSNTRKRRKYTDTEDQQRSISNHRSSRYIIKITK